MITRLALGHLLCLSSVLAILQCPATCTWELPRADKIDPTIYLPHAYLMAAWLPGMSLAVRLAHGAWRCATGPARAQSHHVIFYLLLL